MYNCVIINKINESEVGGVERKTVKIIINTGNTKTGSKITRIPLPIKWARKMDVVGDEREVELIFNIETKEINLKKKKENENVKNQI